MVEKGNDIESVDYGNSEAFPLYTFVKPSCVAANYGLFDFVLVTKNAPDIFQKEDLIKPVVKTKQ